MARIKLDDIREELAKENWQVLSLEYKNLDEVMTFQCPEGHQVYSPWKKLRTRRECPVCKANIYKDQDTKIVSKKKGIKRFLGLDQATKVTGWSIFDGKELVKFGAFSVNETDETARINELKRWLINFINLWQPDYIAIEGIQFQETSGSKEQGYNRMGVTVFQALARLQGVLLDTCYELEIPVEICPTNTWRNHCGVKGRARSDKKRSMQLIAKQLYDVTVTDDEADSIGIGKYLSDTKYFKVEVFNWE